MGFKQFLPAGAVASGQPSSADSFREWDLVQVYTDPGGMRTLALKDIVRVR